MPSASTRGGRRSGAETRAEAQRVALALFSARGFEATSMQQIADELGIKKASLYYHFRGKDEIVESVLEGRSAEAQDLAEWVRAQRPSSRLARRVVLRWIDSLSVEKLRGIRFMTANPLLVKTISRRAGVDIGDDLAAVVDLIAPAGADREEVLLLRMAFMSISSAVAAAADLPGISEEQTIAAARRAAIALLGA